MELMIVNSAHDIGKVVGEIILETIKNKSNPVLGLATGSSPEPVYNYLIEDYKINKTDWSHVKTFNLDEYVGLEPTHPQSYHYYMKDKFFNHINIDHKNTYIPLGIGDYHQQAKEYDNLIQQNNGIDLQLLGVGVNGHIGFNEPPADFNSTTSVVDLVESTIHANSRYFADINQVPKQAVSMGIKSIMQARKIILIAIGEQKAEAIKHLFTGDVDKMWPCTILQEHDDVLIVVDQQAAKLIR